MKIADADAATQLHIEYRGADASANPYLALGAIVLAGLDGVRSQLPVPPILDRDPALLDPDDAERFGVGALPSGLDGRAAGAGGGRGGSWMVLAAAV